MNLITILQATGAAQTVHHSADDFVKFDPSGFGMTIIAMAVVFSALITLYISFKISAKFYSLDLKKQVLLKKGRKEEADLLPSDTTGEINAAIAMALFLYRSELHDHEQTILTIKKVAKTYSPWSSKIYGLRKLPR